MLESELYLEQGARKVLTPCHIRSQPKLPTVAKLLLGAGQMRTVMEVLAAESPV
jgi:hypothetical protein